MHWKIRLVYVTEKEENKRKEEILNDAIYSKVRSCSE